MSDTVIRVENLSKQYRLGAINHGMLYKDVQSWWARRRGKEDPHAKLDIYNKEQLDGDDRFWALRDINFEVKQGDRVGIIGKNGAGKSTLLKILSRVTAPTNGIVKVKGRIASLLEVGTGFHPELSGRENVYLNGAILGMSKREINGKFDEIVDFAGIERFIDTPVKRYSSGMYVRLAFAVAAHLEPEILIVDEVLAVGDAEFQKKAIGKMEDVSKGEGRTILFVSHNMAAVQQLCDKGIVLSKGSVVFEGTANEAVDRYVNIDDRKVIYQNDGFIDLDDIREKVYQEKIFKRIRILNKDNQPCDIFPMLSPMTIEVELENTTKFPEADYCIAIHDKTGQWITSSATWMYPNKKNKKPVIMRIDIPSIKFSPGNYKIYLSMTDHVAGVYIDRFENAKTIYIEAVDVFNSGREFTPDCGIVIPEGELQLL